MAKVNTQTLTAGTPVVIKAKVKGLGNVQLHAIVQYVYSVGTVKVAVQNANGNTVFYVVKPQHVHSVQSRLP
jgi:hypothetical protein